MAELRAFSSLARGLQRDGCPQSGDAESKEITTMTKTANNAAAAIAAFAFTAIAMAAAIVPAMPTLGIA